MSAPTGTLSEVKYLYRELPIDSLRASEFNPRERVDTERLTELTNDIQEHGILEPLIVRPTSEDGVFEIVAGSRRHKAAMAAGLETVPAIIAGRDLSDAEALEIAIAENLRRQDLDPIETAKAYERLASISGNTQKQLAELTGRSQPAVANTMRLLKLPTPVQQMIRSGQLNQWHGIELLRFAEWPAVCEQIAALAVERRAVHTDLKGSLPYARDIVKAGLAVEVPSDLPFASTLQKDRGAYLKAGPGSSYGYYLNVSRYKELKAANDKAEKERQATLKDAALGKPAPVPTGKKAAAPPNRRLPMLDELAPDTVQRLDTVEVPAGCSDDCPCRARALLSDGNTQVPVCVDLRRFRKLDRVSKKSEERRLVAQHQQLGEWLENYVPTLGEFGSAEGAVMFGRSIMWLDPTVQRALAQLNIELPENAGVQSDAFLDWLAGLGLPRLLQIAFVTGIRNELNGDGGLRRPMPVTRWYMGKVGATLPELVLEEEVEEEAPTSAESDASDGDGPEGEVYAEEGAETSGEAGEWPPVDQSEAIPA